MYKLFWSSLQSFFPEQKCQTFAGSSSLDVRILCCSLSFMIGRRRRTRRRRRRRRRGAFYRLNNWLTVKKQQQNSWLSNIENPFLEILKSWDRTANHTHKATQTLKVFSLGEGCQRGPPTCRGLGRRPTRGCYWSAESGAGCDRPGRRGSTCDPEELTASLYPVRPQRDKHYHLCSQPDQVPYGGCRMIKNIDYYREMMFLLHYSLHFLTKFIILTLQACKN